MEANFFRFAAAELFQKVRGQRIQKVYMPGPGLFTLDLGRSGNMILGCSRRQGFFYLCPDRPVNPSTPAAQAMWLRKHLKNRLILNFKNLWMYRRMAFELSGTGTGPGWLILDLVRGPELVSELDQMWDEQVVWPDLLSVLGDENVWKRFPQLSPPLRRELAQRSPDQAQKLLEDLSRGQPEGFFLCRDHENKPFLSCFIPSQGSFCRNHGSALEASQFLGREKTEDFLSAPGQGKQNKLGKQHRKKLEKRVQQLDEDRQRLKQMAALGEKGKLIQASLYQLNPGLKTDEIKIFGPAGEEEVLKLDKKFSIQENMNMFFRLAAKGKRGLEFVAQREKALLTEKPVNATVQGPKSRQSGSSKGREQPFSHQALSGKAHVFRSSDGLTILRAKNSRVAKDLLRQHASPFDLWLHVQDGPGAHTILRLASKDSPVPERSLQEAAVLAALASYQKHELKGRVMCAMIRDVRAVKGAAPGRVVVDRIQQSLVVTLEPELEARLKIN